MNIQTSSFLYTPSQMVFETGKTLNMLLSADRSLYDRLVNCTHSAGPPVLRMVFSPEYVSAFRSQFFAIFVFHFFTEMVVRF